MGFIVRFAAIGYVLFFLGVVLFQKQFIYRPQRVDQSTLEASSLTQGLQSWRNANGEVIGWRVGPSVGVSKHRCLVFYGNQGYALQRAYYAKGLQALSQRGDWEIYIMEYPGYGSRPGSPSEKTLVDAGIEALDHLKKEDSGPVYVIGESLGSGVAAGVASASPDFIAGILLVTPFNNLQDVFYHHFPYLPLKWFLKEKYNAEVALNDYSGPVVFLVAGQDQVVTAQAGEKLYESYHGPKRLIRMDNADHNTIPFSPLAGWWQEAFDFLTKNALITKF